ncbi:MAG TPA: YceH family protein [Planctomycetota bacterium]|nr:YceH family protein [Planctomycetota bacterium]
MSPRIELNPHEARVLGVLVEKELTTPDQYPLSLNALTAGCNQKNNRDPQTDYSEAEVLVALQGLTAKHLAGRTHPAGSRVERFHHGMRAVLEVEASETAVLAELLLRGPQQPGELRTRASRMAPIASLESLVELLERLRGAGWVANLGRRSGERTERWGQTLCPSAPEAPSAEAPRAALAPDLAARVAELEARVAKLESLLEELGG